MKNALQIKRFGVRISYLIRTILEKGDSLVLLQLKHTESVHEQQAKQRTERPDAQTDNDTK